MKANKPTIIKERWFNYRPICLVFLFLLLGSVFGFYITSNLIPSIIALILGFVFLLSIAIVKRNYKYILIPILAFIVGVGSFNLVVNNFNNTNVTNIPNEVEVRINYVGKPTDKYLFVQTDHCKLDGEAVNFNIYLYLTDTTDEYQNIEIGSIIKFQPKAFYKADLFGEQTPNAKLISTNTKYYATASMDKVQYLSTEQTLSETLKERIKQNLHYGLTNENVEFAYSSLFGDRSNIGEDQYNTIRLAGVAHILAVSGLHVGIIVAILSFILKKLKAKNITTFCVVSLVLTLYMMICNFTVSVVRASIMAMILLFAKIIHEEYDIFTSLSFAGIVIYLFNPLCVFDVSFLMSFSCVFCISILNRPIKLALIKANVNEKIASGLSLSMSATVSLMVIMAFYFRTLNAISIIANVILIPLFTLAFIPIFVVGMCSLILPQLCFLLYPVNYILQLVSLIASVFASFKISSLNTIRLNYVIILIYFGLLLIIGRLCSAKYRYKTLATIPILILLFCCLA